MTYARREDIFSKDVITTSELQELLNFSNRPQASKKMGEIKRVVGDRLKEKGRLHIEDYLEFFKIKTNRYAKAEGEEEC